MQPKIVTMLIAQQRTLGSMDCVRQRDRVGGDCHCGLGFSLSRTFRLDTGQTLTSMIRGVEFCSQ